MTQVNNVVNESTIGEKGEIIRVSVSTEESHQATVEGKNTVLQLFDDGEQSPRTIIKSRMRHTLSFLPIFRLLFFVVTPKITFVGPESHSVHTLKSTKIVVEENNSTCDDVEVDDLMKRIQKQRGILEEILTETSSLEKCETLSEGILRVSLSTLFFTLIPCYPKNQKPTPKHPLSNGMKMNETNLLFSIFVLKICTLTHYFIIKITCFQLLLHFDRNIQFCFFFTPSTQIEFFISQKLVLTNSFTQLYVNNCWVLLHGVIIICRITASHHPPQMVIK